MGWRLSSHDHILSFVFLQQTSITQLLLSINNVNTPQHLMVTERGLRRSHVLLLIIVSNVILSNVLRPMFWSNR